jgi:hypothetical protein
MVVMTGDSSDEMLVWNIRAVRRKGGAEESSKPIESGNVIVNRHI